MATRIRARADNLYEQEVYAWSRAQVDLQRSALRRAGADFEP
jgi:hypothetical protein